ncbi:hypothetical protein BDV96DRAFT_596322 [Lophiotrema nucula]|uniref:Zn(2)-C6 fungal-type domain-containing protein n=1 Tax=Lophiotrema nucula TaxID=690887 RepID=A0A6A5ZK14_9PLEO|nr:hypothetical protein BDV96DRAFT_596322 [Lophiotrema nucula]
MFFGKRELETAMCPSVCQVRKSFRLRVSPKITQIPCCRWQPKRVMVYRGKPSAACHSCRKRRIKCDEKRPGCTQCLGIAVTCPGYRNPLDTYFRDESRNVTIKAEASYKLPARKHPSSVKRRSRAEGQFQVITHTSVGNFTPKSTSGHFCEELAVSVMWSNPFQPVGDFAITHFLSSYVPGSQFEYLAELYDKQSLGSPLHATVQAVSLAIFSREVEESSILKKARGRYSEALSVTNAALTDAKLAVQDATLVAVLLLRLFEAIVYAGFYTPNNWTVHTNGALALIKVRGTQQFESELGRRLFHQVGNNLRIDCIQRSTRLPAEFVRLYELSRPFYGDNNPRIDFAALNGELIELLAIGDEGSLGNGERVSLAIQLDRKYSQLMRSLPQSWLYKTSDAQNQHQVTYENTVHQYPSQPAIQLWSSYRMIRILLNEIVCHCSDSQALVIQEKAKRNIQDMARDICISTSWVTLPIGIAASGSDAIPAKACVASLLWPLSSVRGASFAPEKARVFAIEQLRFLGNTFKLPQAVRVASTSYELEALHDGLHMFYGS